MRILVHVHVLALPATFVSARNKIKEITVHLLLAIFFACFASLANATLIDRSDGLIYDTDLNLTWLQNANLGATNSFGISGINANGSMDWSTANQWIAAMNAENYLGYDDWRLPTMEGACAIPYYNGYLYNCSDNEMGYLFYIDLGNSASSGLTNVGPFINLNAKSYWSSTEMLDAQGSIAYRFDFSVGGVDETGESFSFPLAWAVRSGDVSSVPEPATLLLLGLGLAGLGWARRTGQRTPESVTSICCSSESRSISI